MSRRAVLALAAGAGVFGIYLFSLSSSAPPAASGAEARAMALYEEAREALARFDQEGARRLLLAAWETDPGFHPALVEALQLGAVVSSRAILSEIGTLLDRVPESRDPECLAREITVAEGRLVTHGIPTPGRVGSDCETWAEGSPEGRERLWRRHPEVLAYFLGTMNDRVDRPDEAVAMAESMLAAGAHPMVEAGVRGYMSAALHRAGRHDEARAAESAGDRRTAGALPGVRLAYLQGLLEHGVLIPRPGEPPEIGQHYQEVYRSAWDSIVQLVEASGPYLWRLAWLGSRATELLDAGELRSSLDLWDRLELLADSANDGPALAQILVRRGRTYVKLGRYPEAERDLRRGLELARLHGRRYWEFEAWHNLFHLYEGLGREREALDAAESYVGLTLSGPPSPQRMISHRDVAWFLQREGKTESARRHFDAMVATIDSLDAHHYFAGEYFEAVGDLERALAYYARVLPNEQDWLRAVAGLARLSEALGDTLAALEYARLHDERQYRNYPENIPLRPGILARTGRIAEARRELQEARSRARERGQLAGSASLTLELAELEMRAGRPLAAALLADTAREAATRAALGEQAIRARGLAAHARVLGAGGGAESSSGLRDLARAAEEARAVALPALESEAHYRLGDALIRTGKVDEGLSQLAVAADLTDSLAASVTPDPDRAGVRAQGIHISNRAVEAVISGPFGPRERAERFVRWTIRRKARMASTGSRPPALDAVRAKLAADQAILDYVVLDSATAVLVVTRERAEVRRLSVHPDTLARRILALRERMAPRVGSYVDLSRAAFDTRSARALHQELIRPLLPMLEGRNRLVVVPDGPLHLLPFDALVSEEEQNAFLVQTDEVTLQPSFGPPTPGAGIALEPGVVAVIPGGDSGLTPPGAGAEIRQVGAALGGRLRVLEGARASETELRRAASSAAVIHLAVHGYPNDRAPAFARLVLAPDGASDGALHAFEIEELPLHGSLVVLSACDTGAGRLLAGEGVLSLSRAFLGAGASATVATLWPVGAPTAELMGAFYRALAAGSSPAAALRAAKLSLLEGGFGEPFYWAPFVLVSGGG